MIEFSFKPAWYWLVVGGVLIAGLLYWSYRTARGEANGRQRWLLLTLRLLAIATGVLCLLDPQRIEEVRHYQPGRLAVLVDNSRSMDWKDAGERRWDAAQRWLKGELAVPPNLAVASFGFSSNLVAVADWDKTTPSGGATAIADALESLLHLPGQELPASVVLISDGIDTSQKSPQAIAKLYGQKKVPIHTLAVGQTNELPDIVLENVQVRRVVPDQATTRVTLTLRSSGFAGRAVPVWIRQGQKHLVEISLTLNGASQQCVVEFAPLQAGFQSFIAEVPAQPGERLAQNNQREFAFTVVDRKVRVLYMEASGVQQGKVQPLFLKHALEDSPGITVKTLYCEQHGTSSVLNNKVAFTDSLNGDKIYRVQHPTLGFPRTIEALLQYDVVIVSDIPKEEFTQMDLFNLERFVTEHGGGFIMVGGNTSFGAGRYQKTVIDRIIPVAMGLTSPDYMEEDFHARIPETAWSHPIMQLGRDAAETRKIWTEKLPKLRGLNLVDRAKPGALVLAEHSTRTTQFGAAVLLAVQEVGRGRSMAMTFDTTFLWGEWFQSVWGEPLNPAQPLSELNCDARYYKQFWRNTVRWLAAHRVASDLNFVTLELDQSCVPPGTELPVQVRAQNREGKEVVDAQVTVEVKLGELEGQRVPALFDEQKHRYLAAVRIPATGRYLVRAAAEFKDGKTGEDRQILTCEEFDRETLDLRARPETLADISRCSGGTVFAAQGNDPKAMKTAVGGSRLARLEYRRTPLWDTWIWLTAMVGLLSVEWVVRRLRGLA